MRIKMTICIAVYNQINLVEKLLSYILSYKERDIEIVITDDCSEDDIEGMVRTFADDRIVYCKTEKNEGHDLNILNGLKNSSCNYVFLLRSRDFVNPEKINKMIDIMYRYPNAVYFDFSAIDEKGSKRLLLSDKVYRKGKDTCRAHCKLLVHPSGHVYDISRIDLENIEKFIRKSFNHKLGFIVHDLLRISLLEEGDFITSKEITWLYTNTNNAKDVAVNIAPKKNSVYAPVYEYERFVNQFIFIRENSKEKYQIILLKNIIKRFYKSVGFDFYYINSNKKLQRHYNYEMQPYSKKNERKKFRKLVNELIEDMNYNKKFILYTTIYYETVLCVLIYPLKKSLYNIVSKSKMMPLIIRCIKNR